MVDIVEILAVAAITALVTILIRELFAWKFSELERRRKKLEVLLEKVYGPIRVVTWRMDLDVQKQHSFHITREEYMEIRRIVFLYGYEFEKDYQKLIDSLLHQGKKAIGSLVAQMAEKPTEIHELIKKTEEEYQKIIKRIKKLHKMRNGFINNLRFLFFTWREF